MLQAVEVEVGENGQVRLREPLELRGWHRAVLTVLGPLESKQPERDVTNGKESTDLLRFLHSSRLPGKDRLSAQEIDAQIAEGREAWD